MKNNLYGCDIVSMQDLPLSRIKLILETAARLKSQRALHLLKKQGHRSLLF